MKLRTILFWLHLPTGLIAGAVIFIMSVTGTLLTFQQQVLKTIERSQRTVEPPADATRLDVDVLLARARGVAPKAQPTTLTLESDPKAAATIAFGTQGLAFVNPYNGDVLGTGSARARAFYRSLTNLHRYLAFDGPASPKPARAKAEPASPKPDRAEAGRAITGACNAAFLVLAVTGLYLWWPRQWTARHVASVMLFRRGLRGKARDFNWHNVIGFWCAPIIIVLTMTGMVISYAWAGNLVYTLTGSPRPAAAGTRGVNAEPQPARAEARAGLEAASLESLVAEATRAVPTWRTLVIRLPQREGGQVTFTISDRDHWNAFARSTLTVTLSPGTTGAIVRWEPYQGTSLGQKVRGWMRFAHTGELGGIPGEAIAGLASAGGAFLVWTGCALALRRLVAWRVRRRPPRQVAGTLG
jgi:uncharacterized iron-regulated membrane protein